MSLSINDYFEFAKLQMAAEAFLKIDGVEFYDREALIC